MNELVIQRKDEAVTTSLKVAEMFHKRHDTVLRDIRALDCSADFTAHNFVESKYKDSTGKTNQMFYLTKDGFIFLVMGYRGKKAAEFKEAYIKAFNKMESFLKEKATSAWIETRYHGKITRKAETDMIKQLAEYAKEQGSANSDKLFITYTNLANKMCGLEGKGARDSASIYQLNNLSIYENLILQLIRGGMEQGLYYKEIYKLCKERCIQAQEVAMIGG